MCDMEEMKEILATHVQTQLTENLEAADYHEIGAAIDMIKDLSEAIYYCTIVEAMHNKEISQEEKDSHLPEAVK